MVTLGKDNLEIDITEILDQKEEIFWLSFCDSSLPEGSQFLGVVIARAFGVTDASSKAWKLNINPGGEVIPITVPEGLIEPEYFDRLLTKAESLKLADEIDAMMRPCLEV